MSLLSRIIGLFQSRTISNPYFGDLRWIPVKKSGDGGYFEGKRVFRGKAIEVTINGKIGDTLEEQNRMFLFIEENYEPLIEKAFPLIKKELSLFQVELDYAKFQKEFDLAGLSIEEKIDAKTEWDMGFGGKNGCIFYVTVFFNDTDPHIVTVDT